MKMFIAVLAMALVCGSASAGTIDEGAMWLLEQNRKPVMSTDEEVASSSAPVSVGPIGVIIYDGTPSAILLTLAYQGYPVSKAKVVNIGTFKYFNYYGSGVWYTFLSAKQTKKVVKKLIKGKNLIKGTVWSTYSTQTKGWFYLIN